MDTPTLKREKCYFKGKCESRGFHGACLYAGTCNQKGANYRRIRRLLRLLYALESDWKPRPIMKYYKRNVLAVEYPTSFLDHQLLARLSWATAWTELSGDEKVRFIEKGQTIDRRGFQSRKNMILISIYCSKEIFINEISRFFSKKLNANPQDLQFHFKYTSNFGDLNE